MTVPVLQVVVAICRHPDGRVLLSERPAGSHLAGRWEFPGGKVDVGETPTQALRRELAEELGIPLQSQPRWLMQRHFTYPDRHVQLRVAELALTPTEAASVTGAEGQRLAWCALNDPRFEQMPPANAPIMAALRWPSLWAISPDSSEPELLLDWARSRTAAMATGMATGWVLRAPQLPWWLYLEVAREVLSLAQAQGAPLMLHGHVQALVELPDAAGLHLPTRLWRAWHDEGWTKDKLVQARICQPQHLLAGAAHDAGDLATLEVMGLDWAWLSPVHATASHTGEPGMGWDDWQALACATRLPVVALGGITPNDLAQARNCGGFAVAGIRGF